MRQPNESLKSDRSLIARALQLANAGFPDDTARASAIGVTVAAVRKWGSGLSNPLSSVVRQKVQAFVDRPTNGVSGLPQTKKGTGAQKKDYSASVAKRQAAEYANPARAAHQNLIFQFVVLTQGLSIVDAAKKIESGTDTVTNWRANEIKRPLKKPLLRRLRKFMAGNTTEATQAEPTVAEAVSMGKAPLAEHGPLKGLPLNLVTLCRYISQGLNVKLTKVVRLVDRHAVEAWQDGTMDNEAFAVWHEFVREQVG